MTHVRDQIMDWVNAQLVAISNGAPVLEEEVYDVAAATGPAWLLFWEEEESGYDGNMKPRGKTRSLLVSTIYYVKGAGQAARKTLDDMAEAVEDRMETDETAGGLAEDLELVATDRQATSEPQAHMAIGLRWRFQYRTRQGSAGQPAS